MSANDFPVPAETAKAPKGSVARLIQVAKSQVGYIEGPKDNETKYGAYTKANFQPWCGSFVNWCANEAGVKIPNTVYTPGGAAAFKKANSWIDGDIADPEPGDIAYFDFPSDGVDRISHVGIVIEDNEDGTVITKMGPYGVLKEILLQRNQEAKEMAEKLVNNFVLLRKTKQEFKFQL